MSDSRPSSRPTRVFISYSHDSPTHGLRVLALSDRLRAEGVDCHIDQYEESPSEGWPRWMVNQVSQVDYVLVVCTKTYEHRFRGVDALGRGLGARWEGAILNQELYEAAAENTRFIPVVFTESDSQFIPIILRVSTRYVLDDEMDYERLYRRLTGQPSVIKPALGSLRPLEPRSFHAGNPLPPSILRANRTGDYDGWATNLNARFGYEIRHPVMWPIGAESDNGDGVWFYTVDFDSRVSASGSHYFPEISASIFDRRGLKSRKFQFDDGSSGELLIGERDGLHIYTAHIVQYDIVGRFWAEGTESFIRSNGPAFHRMARSLRILPRP
jgi:hypothetical protein